MAIRVDKKGYQCWDRDEIFFRYVITTSLIRKPKATEALDVHCRLKDLARIEEDVKAIFSSYVSFNDYVDPREYYLWLLGLQ